MVINLKTLPTGHSQLSQKVVMSEEQQQESGLESAVDCTAAIDVLQWQIHIALSFACSVHLECSRCLKAYSQKIGGECRIILLDKNAPQSEMSDDDVDMYFSREDDEIDVRAVLYDEVMTAMPLMPLCRADCEGIQIKGGKKQGGGDNEQAYDPRWEALKKLKQKKIK